MYAPITIRLYSSEVRIKTEKGVYTTVPLHNLDNIRSNCLDWAIDIARISEKYQEQVTLSDGELAEALKVLADVGQKIAHNIFSEEWNTVKSILKQYSETDILIQGSDELWVPWELLHFGGPRELSLQDFCGFKRNIYRVPRRRGQRLDLGDAPAVGFLTHDEVPFEEDEFAFLGSLSKSGKIDRKPTVSFRRESEGKKELLDWIKSLKIVHLAGLLAPVQYVDQSYILVNTDFCISPSDFLKPIYNRHKFNFTSTPLIIFNVRDNYARHPMHVSDYANLLLDKRAFGVIASEFPVPPVLAVKFAERFYHFLFKNEKDKSIGQALLDAKVDIIENDKNPFAMFYAPYFEPVETHNCSGRRESMQPIGVPNKPPINLDELCDLLDERTTEQHVRRLLNRLGDKYPNEPSFRSYDNLTGQNKFDKIYYILETLKSYGDVIRALELLIKIKKDDTKLREALKRFKDDA